jgi:hypothetical protein
VAIYCNERHRSKDVSTHEGVLEELRVYQYIYWTRGETTIGRCKVTTYCSERHRSKDVLTQESLCEELREYL